MILLPQVEQVLRYWRIPRPSVGMRHCRTGRRMRRPYEGKPGAAERKTRCGDRPGFGWLRHSSQGCLFLLESRYIVEGFFGFPSPRRRVGAEAGWSTPKNGRRTVARISRTASENTAPVPFESAYAIWTSWQHSCDRDGQALMQRGDRVGNVTF